MYRLAAVAALSLAYGLCFLAESSAAAGKKKAAEKSDPGLTAVERVLRAESAGEVDRRGQLAETLKQHPDSVASRWQAGFVRDGDAWHSFDATPSATEKIELFERYRFHRLEAPQTFARQLELADWCRKQKLADQERAHLLAALALAAGQDQPALLHRLGYRQVGLHWVGPEDVRAWERIHLRAEASLKKWSSKLDKLAERLTASPAQRNAALAELHGVKDSSIIPALELVLAGRDETCALAAIDVMRRFEGPEATLALARQGVFSVWPALRKSAGAALKERTLDDFVPALIGLLETPATGEYRMSYDRSRGILFYSYVLAAEMENQFQVAALNAASQVVIVRAADLGTPRGALRDSQLQRATDDSLRAAADVLYPRERQREAMNDRIDELNGHIIAVLSEVTELEPTPDPRKWWQWWYDYTDAPPAGTKSVVVVSETEAIAPTLIPFTHSCFAAGTPVWTETGLLPIQTIEVGDRVLAQDIESGELSYKPVLQTTENPPKALLSVQIGDETIVCTKGHRFWISGTGWTMARQLEPQALLHTATGNVPVWSVKPAPAAKTYNLVVDGFHTYFVGKSAILCQDLRRSDGANCLVPGLHREDLAHATK
jgi:hypothetical protein